MRRTLLLNSQYMMKYDYSITILPDPRFLCVALAVLIFFVQGKPGKPVSCFLSFVVRETFTTKQVF